MSRLAIALSCALAAAPVAAQMPDELVTVEVLNGWRDPGGVHIAAIRLTLADGWKTYWRSPGAAGIPPRFDWSGSQNIDRVGVHWPVPIVFEDNGYTSVGYSGAVVLPIQIAPQDAASVVTMVSQIDIGVCEAVCVPVRLDVSAVLSPDTAAPDPEIMASVQDRPATAGEAGAGPVTCAIEPISDGMRLTAVLNLPVMGSDEFAVVEFSDPSVWVSEAKVTRDGKRLVAEAELVPTEAKPFLVARSDLRFTILADGAAVEIKGCTG